MKPAGGFPYEGCVKNVVNEHAVRRGGYLAGVTVTLLALSCADLTAPSAYGRRGDDGAAPQANTAQVRGNAQPGSTAAQPPTPTPRVAVPAGDSEQIRASHVLIAFKGARGGRAERSKEEAKKLAEQVRARAASGTDFAKLASDHSDGPTKSRGGDLGKFARGRMVKPFADAAFALKPGGISNVVETPFGFHVIKRTE